MLPTFIGIGAQRARTTWTYNCLNEHPEVFMTQKKELHFFYVKYGRGLDWNPQSEAFMSSSTSTTHSDCYSVFKKPLGSALGWRKELSPKDAERVLPIIRRSEIAALYYSGESWNRAA